MRKLFVPSIFVFSVFSSLGFAAELPADQTPPTIDKIIEVLNQPIMTEVLGPLKTDFLVAKSIGCAFTSSSPLNEAQAAQVASKYPVKLSGYKLGILGEPFFELSNTDDAGNNEMFQVAVSSLGVTISQGDKPLVQEIMGGNTLCQLGFITRHEYTADGRPLIDLMPTDQGVKETDINSPPKSLESIYGGAGYDSKSLQRLESINEDSSRIGIAVIDIGVDYNDPVFAYKTDRKEVGLDLVENDFIPSDLGGTGMALIGDEGHGTSVSTLAVAGSDQLSLIPIRHNVLALASEDVKAIDYASKRGARIVNMSFGYMGPKETQEDLMQVCSAIHSHSDMLFVAAADDSDQDNDAKPIYPASCNAPNLISVGSVNFFNRKSDFSGYGKNTIQIAAKGEGLNLDVGYGSKKKESGTSFAAPQVANVAGKILVINPNLDPVQVIQILVESASKHSSLAQYFQSSGVLDEGKALDMARKTFHSSK